jgi:hypothetical protein
MTFAEVIQRFEAEYLGLNEVDKTKYLSLLCFYITIIARGTYPELRQGDARSAEMLMTFNEAVHRVSSQLCSILTEEDEPTYPHNVFFPMLANYGTNEQLQAELAWALSRAWEIFLNSTE